MTAQPKWRKILYEHQGVPDHYVDETFLDELKKNLYIREYEYWKVVKESGVVIHQLCSVCIFVVIFIYMDNHVLSPEALVVASAVLTLIGYSINWAMMKKSGVQRMRTLLDDVKTLLIFAGFSYSLSPVLVSLTETIATDTIYAMTTVMLLANLFSHDYGADAEMVSGVLSLNTGLFASVCMASRLHTAWHSFALVTFAIQVFALWPALRRNLRQGIPASHTVLTVVLSIVTVVSFMSVSLPAAIMFMIVNVFITFVCPAWLVTIQPFKNNIYGPWDEAVIED